ncbi:conserved hypothetical protein [Pseudomonas jessenii]
MAAPNKPGRSAMPVNLMQPHVGAGLLAKAATQSTQMSPDTPLSRASPLPQGPALD